MLKEELEDLGIEPTEPRIEALWEVKEKQITEKWSEETLAEHGIRRVPVTYPWGHEIRYAIQGISGLWGKEFVTALREEEGW
jgi:hypothetical protein